MKALVVCDSFFGNAEKIAQAIGAALGDDVEVLRVSNVKPKHLAGLDMLVVGSPTRGFRATPAIMEMMKGIPADGLRGVKVAAFDTRIPLSAINSRIGRFFVARGGYAANPILAELTKKGGVALQPLEGFSVKDREGPLIVLDANDG
jgi:flavodoxin